MKKIISKIILFPRKILIGMIVFYQRHITTHTKAHCIYTPTCSEYARQAVDKYGIIKGSFLSIIRILKCNPFSKGGVDLLK